MQTIDCSSAFEGSRHFPPSCSPAISRAFGTTSKERFIISKDSKGDPSRNRLKITVDLSLLDESQNLITSKVFEENLEYNVDDNKFNLRQYEKNIKQNLVEEITQQMLLYLANVK